MADTFFGNAGPIVAAQMPALTGDVTSAIGTVATSLVATANATLASLDKSTGVAVHGTNTNNSAAAGYVGEYVESVITSLTSVGVNGNYFDATSISLTSGDWDVTAVFSLHLNGATAVTNWQIGISVTSGNSSTGLQPGSNRVDSPSAPTAASDQSLSVPSYRLAVGGTTTVYLKGNITYATSTPTFVCRLSARRIR